MSLLFLAISIVPHVFADQSAVASNGDSFTIFKSKDENNALIYELRRMSPKGDVATLWRSAPQTQRQERVTTPQPAILSLSSIAAICEEQNQISVLVFDGESDALVFCFAPAASTATQIRINNLLRAGDPPGVVRFKHHGELIFVSPDSKVEKLIRFDPKGQITEDFRSSNSEDTVVNLVSSGEGESKALQVPSQSPPPIATPGVKSPAETKTTESTPATASDKQPASIPWLVWAVMFVTAAGLLWLWRRSQS